MTSHSNLSVGDQPTGLSEEEYHRDVAIVMIPVMAYLGLLMLIGLFGNILVLYVYIFRLKRSTTNLFITALTVFDIVVCSVCIPVQIVVIRYLYSFNNPWVCRILGIIVPFCILGSGGILIIIAVDRYKRICTPFRKQISIKRARVAIAIVCVLSGMCASPSMAIYGSRTVNKTFTGHACATDDSMIQTPYPGLFKGMQFVIAIVATITLTALYSLILRTAKEHERHRKVQKIQKNSKQNDNATYVDNASDGQTNLDSGNPRFQPRYLGFSTDRNALSSRNTLNEDVSSSVNVTESFQHEITIDNDVTTVQHKSNDNNNTAVGQSKHEQKRSHKTTLMMFLITAVFVVSFIPHLGLMITRAVQKHTFEHLEGVPLAVYHIFLRTYFINSASNPLIYSFLSDKFRREIKILLRRPHAATM